MARSLGVGYDSLGVWPCNLRTVHKGSVWGDYAEVRNQRWQARKLDIRDTVPFSKETTIIIIIIIIMPGIIAILMSSLTTTTPRTGSRKR
eukprot:g8918.t1